ncbi:14940_t:CDS:2, partial [Cetraspora pellucida]
FEDDLEEIDLDLAKLSKELECEPLLKYLHFNSCKQECDPISGIRDKPFYCSRGAG